MNQISSVQATPPVRMIEQPLVQQRSVESSDATVAQQQHSTDQSAQDTLQQSSQQAASSSNYALEVAQRQIQFAVDKETRRTVIKIVDPETNEVVRQIPPEESLRILRMISRLVRDRGAVTDERV